MLLEDPASLSYSSEVREVPEDKSRESKILTEKKQPTSRFPRGRILEKSSQWEGEEPAKQAAGSSKGVEAAKSSI